MSMSSVDYIWVGLGGIITILWLRRHVNISRAQSGNFTLSPKSESFSTTGNTPFVSIVVPARDEAEGIERTIRSLLAQDYSSFELVVVNDRSTDATPEILERITKEHADRMRICNVSEEREGWFGKSNAIQTGLAVARGEYYLFTDADCDFRSPRTLSVAMNYATRNNTGFLTITPETSAGGWWASVLLPVCTGILMIWHPPERVNDPSSRAAYANGAFMLLRRDVYDRIGGHASVRSEICEDMALARRAKAMAIDLRMVRSEGLYGTTMYSTLPEAWRGWARILTGSLVLPRRVVAAMLLVAISSLLPWVITIGSAVALLSASVDTDRSWIWLMFVWGAACLAQQSTTIRAYPLIGVRRSMAFTYVLGALLALGIMFEALLRTLGLSTTVWRGRSYRSGRVDEANSTSSGETARADG